MTTRTLAVGLAGLVAFAAGTFLLRCLLAYREEIHTMDICGQPVTVRFRIYAA